MPQLNKNLIKPLYIVMISVVLALSIAALIVHKNSENSYSEDNRTVISKKGWSKGNLSASTTLVEFGDYQCGGCANSRQWVDSVVKMHDKELLFVFKHFPLKQHKNAMLAAHAAEAAGAFGKFWEMHEALFSTQLEWQNLDNPLPLFLKYAHNLEIDSEKFKVEFWKDSTNQKIYNDLIEGQIADLKMVPSFFLNSELIQPRSETQFKDLVEETIKKSRQ